MSDSVPPKISAWEDLALRLIAIYKLAHALLFYVLGFGLLKLMHHNVVQFVHSYIIDPFHFDSESESGNPLIIWLLAEAAKFTPHKILSTSVIVFLYATVFLVEGIGLYLRKHWAEYMVLLVTGSFLPFEVYALTFSLLWWKFVLLFGNLFILSILTHRLIFEATHKSKDGAPPEKGLGEPPVASSPIASQVDR